MPGLSTLAAVNSYHFNQLHHKVQLAAVFHLGTFLATRWQAESEAVNLYAMPGNFFVELTYDTATNGLLDLRSFRNTAGLAAYAVSVQLPDWLNC
ncbi:hypothetical protein GCM10027594_01500 [Hymenobacter agri]